MPIPRSLLSRDGVPDLDLAVVSGVVPDDLAGEILVSTSDQGTAAGGHAFFGDGVMCRLSLRPGSFGAPADRHAWRARPLDTASRRLRERHPEQFTPTATGPSSPFGYSNCANTAPLPWGDRLFATWDAGRPVEIDPVSLGVVGEVGHRDDWLTAIDAPVLPLVVSSAHPVIDPDRNCLWTVAVNPMDHTLEIIRYAGTGTRVQHWRVAGAAIPQSTHTITQTRDWLIVADCGFRPDPNEIFGGERGITTFTDEPVHLIRKEHLETTPSGAEVTATTLRVGPEVMHYYAQYDDRDGVRILFAHTRNVDLAYWVRPDDTDAHGNPVDPALAGMYNHPMSPGRVAVIEFDPEAGTVTDRAAVEDHDAFWVTQLEAMDWSTEGMSRPTLHHQMFTGFRPEVIVERAIAPYVAEGRVDRAQFPTGETPSVLASFERDTMKPTAVWEYPLDDYATSPCFVPRDPGADPTHSRYAGRDPGGHDGYLVAFVHNDAGFRVEIFDAAGVDAGPVATLASPDGATVPFLLHSAWMPRAVPAPDVERLRLVDEITDDHLAALPDDLAASVRAVAAEMP